MSRKSRNKTPTSTHARARQALKQLQLDGERRPSYSREIATNGKNEKSHPIVKEGVLFTDMPLLYEGNIPTNFEGGEGNSIPLEVFIHEPASMKEYKEKWYYRDESGNYVDKTEMRMRKEIQEKMEPHITRWNKEI